MAAHHSQEKFIKRKLINSYFSVVISIALVLFLVGLLGSILLNSQRIANHFKEQIVMTIYYDNMAKQVEIKQLNKSLKIQKETKEVRYISKEQAAKSHAADIGEDFIDFLGYNPLLDSSDVFFKAQYVTPIFLKQLKHSLEEKSYVSEVLYDEPLLEVLDRNITKISRWIVLICGFFVFVAILLINSSIRLSVYSKRMIIKTMQLVGATKRFIRRPFIWQHLKLGIIGSIIALSGLYAMLHYIDKEYPELHLMQAKVELAVLFVATLLLGIFITWISTFFATQRFLNLRTNEVN